MTNFDLILDSAIGQLLAIGIVVVSWTLVQVWRVLSSFAKAANQTRVKITCEPKG
jgi:hypothetical protein